jgi:catechol 2,3-dioxygenase-like lactoylglutathione lyase family enzyme
MEVSIRHTGIVVQDLKKNLDFWRECLGFEVLTELTETGSKIDAMLGLDRVDLQTVKLIDDFGQVVELLKFHSHPSNPVWDGSIYQTGPTHLALNVDDIMDFLHQSRSYGVLLIGDIVKSKDESLSVAFVSCLEGLVLELVQKNDN